LNLNKNADISIFLKKEGQNISSQISIEFAFTYRKANTFKKDLLTTWQMVTKKKFDMFLITKSSQKRF